MGDVGVTSISVVTDAMGNTHLIFTNAVDDVVYRRFDAASSTWDSAVTLYTGMARTPTLSIYHNELTNTDTLQAFFIDSDKIYALSGISFATNTKWDSAVWGITPDLLGTNINLGSMYELNSLTTPLLWTNSDSDYRVDSMLVSLAELSHNVGGDWDASTGTFNAGTSTVTLSGSGAQAVTTGGLTNEFNTLTITNASADGVTFSDALYVGTINALSGVQKLSFSNTGIHTIRDSFNVHGSEGNLITLAPVTAGTPWYLDAPSTTVSYVNVSWSILAADKTITAENSLGSDNSENWHIEP
jgi:hypothetical protein